jgi:penicillin-insensitive murein DD-endopeptidase
MRSERFQTKKRDLHQKLVQKVRTSVRSEVMRFRVLELLIFVTFVGNLLVCPKAYAQKRMAHSRQGKFARRSVSLGSPSEGHLAGGEQLRSNAHLRIIRKHSWGLPHLVHMLRDSSRGVAKRFPGSVLAVGDLSKHGGGDVLGHRSHESGRDADVGFYIKNKHGKFVFRPRYFTINPAGRVVGNSSWQFDEQRNWALIESWLRDPKIHVSHIFVVSYVRKRLLAYAQRVGRPLRIRNLAAEVMRQPKHVLAHDNHFHVRISCPRNQRSSCVEYQLKKNKPHRRRERSKRSTRHRLAKHHSKNHKLPTFAS